MMLKCINPNEAKFLDPAAGIHIKFRLAGVRNVLDTEKYFGLLSHIQYSLCNVCFSDCLKGKDQKLYNGY